MPPLNVSATQNERNNSFEYKLTILKRKLEVFLTSAEISELSLFEQLHK